MGYYVFGSEDDADMIELLIEHPPGYEPERQYIYNVIFGEFWGIGYQTRIGADSAATVISVCGDTDVKRLVVHEGLFATPPDQWLTQGSLPHQPLNKWALPDILSGGVLVSSENPIIYGKRVTDNSYYAEHDGSIQLGLDTFGSAFFMLTRYEEVVKSDRDEHGRFPAGASLAYQEGFLQRPIVNEYLEILWRCMERLWPGLRRKGRKYSLCLSHDIDRPFAVAGMSWPLVLRSCGADLLRRRDPELACRRISARRCARHGDFSNDPFNTFEFIMDVSEQYGLRSSFYFMAAATPSSYDVRYRIDDPWIRRLIRSVSERGHEIGYHGSYRSLAEPALTRLELEALLGALYEEGVESAYGGGGRQHYLRWQADSTWEVWDEAGLAYDSSLAFADHLGFRCGICYEYPTYGLRSRRCLSLRERPLTAMEGTALSSRYMGLSPEEAYRCICRANAECRRFDGQSALLWHNSSLSSRHEKELYERVISALAK